MKAKNSQQSREIRRDEKRLQRWGDAERSPQRESEITCVPQPQKPLFIEEDKRKNHAFGISLGGKVGRLKILWTRYQTDQWHTRLHLFPHFKGKDFRCMDMLMMWLIYNLVNSFNVCGFIFKSALIKFFSIYYYRFAYIVCM